MALDLGERFVPPSRYRLADSLGCAVFGWPPSCQSVTTSPLRIWTWEVTTRLQMRSPGIAPRAFPAKLRTPKLDMGSALAPAAPTVSYPLAVLSAFHHIGGYGYVLR